MSRIIVFVIRMLATYEGPVSNLSPRPQDYDPLSNVTAISILITCESYPIMSLPFSSSGQ